MPSHQPVGVLSPSYQTLSAAQRQEFLRLRAQGIDEPIARALAQALAKSSVKKWLGSKALAKAAWDESAHPRNKVGEFDEGGGGGSGKAEGKGGSKSSGDHVKDMQAHRAEAQRHGAAADKALAAGKADEASEHMAAGRAASAKATASRKAAEKAMKAEGKPAKPAKGGAKSAADHEKDTDKHMADAKQAMQRGDAKGAHAALGRAEASQKASTAAAKKERNARITRQERKEDSAAEQQKGLRKSAEDDEPKHADPKTKGAAFQYARRLNAQRGGNKKNVRQIAEDYLTRRGHAPLTSKKVAKAAVQVEDAGLTLAQLAASLPQPLAKKHFPKSFVAAAKDTLPPYYYDLVHQRARSRAGGHASGEARRVGSDRHLTELQDKQADLQAQLAAVAQAIAEHPCNNCPPEDATLGKTGMEGQSHVDVPLGSQSTQKRPQKKSGQKRRKKDLEKSVGTDVHMAMAAVVDPSAPQDQRVVNAARLVAGMDWELFVGANGAEDARSRASRQLAQDLAYYDSKLQTDDALRRLHGLDVDLGSGQVRQPGYLGLDLYPYDHGTAVHDLGLGLPFEDASCRALRLVNALQYMPDFAEDATPLLVDAQRCLTPGGKLFYQGRGDLTQLADFTQLPGLVLVDHKDTAPLPGQDPTTSDLHIQTFERVRVRVPRIFGADPTWLGGEEQGPDDIAFAMAAMGGNAPADRTMEALLVKSGAPKGGDPVAPFTNAQMYKKIVYSVVYAPNELDFDGEYMEADDIEKMAHAAYREQVPIKVEHGGDPIGAHIVESYIAPADFVMKGVQGPQHVPKGAWVTAIQFTDDAQWQKVLSGAYRGVSVGGRALYEHR